MRTSRESPDTVLETDGMMISRGTNPKKRVGRRGSLLCPPCRKAKRGYNCVVSSEHPSGACSPCIQRGIEDRCRTPTYPERRPKAKRRITAVDISGYPPGTGSSDSATASLEGFLSYALPSSFPDSQHGATAMNSSLIDNPVYQFHEPQIPNDFAESSSDPNVSAYRGNQDFQYFSPPTGHPDAATILNILFTCVPFQELDPITRCLESYFSSCPHRITGFRAGVVRLVNDEKLWPVVEWREDNDINVLAIFKVMGPDIPCGYLMHYGEGIAWGERKRWQRSSLTWQVAAIGDFGDLIVVAQHCLGMLHWSDVDIVSLYLKDCPQNYSDEQLTEHAKRVVSQLFHIKQAKTSFEKVSRIIEKLSARAGMSPILIFIYTAVVYCGEDQHNILRGTLEL